MLHGPVVVVLAAGRGSRFGAGRNALGHKLAQDFAGSTVIGSTLCNVLRSGLSLVVVTTAELADGVAAFVPPEDVVLVPAVGSDGVDLPLGMGYSIAVGVSARAQASGWVVMPADMPMVQPESLRAVAGALPQHPVVYAQHRGRRGHPVAFAAELYSELAMLSGDDGARRLVARYPAHGLELPDAGVLMDLDTVADLQALRTVHAARRRTVTTGSGS